LIITSYNGKVLVASAQLGGERHVFINGITCFAAIAVDKPISLDI
jgi:hypothetical protein